MGVVSRSMSIGDIRLSICGNVCSEVDVVVVQSSHRNYLL